ncbi:MAG: CRISPR-associated protein Cas4 [Betaproteobacteria bacterium]
MNSIGDDPIPLSALNHWGYCPRRYYLIHVEGEFVDNIHTSRGQAEHQRVDEIRHETTGNCRIETALPVWSDRLGLVGKCDVVEFLADGTPYPVEYKHGARKKWINDDLQLAAQALCLEEMTGKPVPTGAIYHLSSRRRREVLITAALREEVVHAIAAIREIICAGKSPNPVNDRRCDQCSLKEICQPAAVGNVSAIAKAHRVLFDPES